MTYVHTVASRPAETSHDHRLWRDCALTVAGVVLVAVAHIAWVRRGLVIDVVAAAFLVPLVLVDIRERRLPDGLTLGGTVTLVTLLAVRGAATGNLAPVGGAVLGALAMAGLLLALHLASPSGMGFGDVKLGLLLGVIVGSRSVGLVPVALLAAGILGAVAGVVLMVRHRRRDVTLPFGPYLVIGAAAALAFAVIG
ncbi:MAG TPA: A24 family peptidase [Acidimicrobiales bacterium]